MHFLKRVRFVLWHEIISIGNRSQKHFAQSQPIRTFRRGHQRLQIVTAHISVRPLVDALRRTFKQSKRHIAIQKRLPLQQEATCILYALRITAPMLESVIGEGAKHLEALVARRIEMALFVDLLEYPGLDESSTADHDARDAGRHFLFSRNELN